MPTVSFDLTTCWIDDLPLIKGRDRSRAIQDVVTEGEESVVPGYIPARRARARAKILGGYDALARREIT